jgi:RNA polymerase sigma-70 factor (ECF subfamily)
VTAAKRIEVEAANWVVRHEDARKDVDVRAHFETWLRSSLRHRAAHLRLKAAWRRSAAMKRLRPVDQGVNPDLLTKELPKRNSRAALIEQLFREHNRALIRFLMNRLRSSEEAADVAQEAYARMLQLDSLGTVSYLRAFLFTTASRIAIDRLRLRQAEARRAERLLSDGLAMTLPVEQHVSDAEELRLTRTFIEELPPKYREALLLSRFEPLSTAAIAARMGVAERTVQHYIVESLVYIRARLDQATRPQPPPAAGTVR